MTALSPAPYSPSPAGELAARWMNFPPDISIRTLENGLRLVLHPDPALPLVAINLWYRVGSKNESPGRTGFAHLFEHMLFQGSANIGANEHFRYVQAVGGVANGSTWYDRTNYFETLPAAQLELGLWLESDRLGFLLEGLSAEKLETQRQVVMNERRERVDNQPYGRASERLFELLVPEGHPYRWPVIGTMEDIRAASIDDVRSFFSKYYRPNNAVLSLAGDFEPDAAHAAVARWFGELVPGVPVTPVRAPLPPLARPERERIPDRVQLSRVYLGFRTAPFGEPDWWAASAAANVLADGKSSPLVDDLVVGRELAQDVAAYVYPTQEVGFLVVVATARPGVEPERLEEAIRSHLDCLGGTSTSDGVARPTWELATELERAKRRSLAAIHSELQVLDQRADLLSQYTTFFDDPARAFHEAADVEAVDAGALARFAASRLGESQCVSLYVDPEPGGP